MKRLIALLALLADPAAAQDFSEGSVMLKCRPASLQLSLTRSAS